MMLSYYKTLDSTCSSYTAYHLVCFVQVGKKFQQPAGTTPKQYERAQFMLDRLGLSVSSSSLCSVATD